jgi:hypothetical protein
VGVIIYTWVQGARRRQGKNRSLLYLKPSSAYLFHILEFYVRFLSDKRALKAWVRMAMFLLLSKSSFWNIWKIALRILAKGIFSYIPILRRKSGIWILELFSKLGKSWERSQRNIALLEPSLFCLTVMFNYNSGDNKYFNNWTSKSVLVQPHHKASSLLSQKGLLHFLKAITILFLLAIWMSSFNEIPAHSFSHFCFEWSTLFLLIWKNPLC